MKLSQIILKCKPLCKLDNDDDEFNSLITEFINDVIGDLYTAIKQPTILYVPVINGMATVDDGYQILRIEPTLQGGDRIIGKTIMTSSTGTLQVYVTEEISPLINDDDDLDMQNHILRLIPYGVASLWHGFKRRIDMANYWKMFYEEEKSKRFDVAKAEETYEIGLPFASFWN